MRSVCLAFIAAAALTSSMSATAHAQFAGDSDYEYVTYDPVSDEFLATAVYPNSSPFLSLQDFYYDYEVYYFSGWWRLLTTVDRFSQAQQVVADYAWTGLEFDIRAVYRPRQITRNYYLPRR